ncbi:DoxX family protein [Pseudonocardia dioxanivorans]|uniref:DoxX family protein n=1 Tax=Pseudonocardia dioxanivorans TaxID=240495 RepID=UPI000CD2243E|nr:DoxX family protein [Pseudonocardia dioxanivorans]
MTATAIAPAATTGRVANRALWTVQIVVGLFLVVGSAAPKLFGQEYAVAMFEAMGSGQWLRYVVGVLELAGGVGLLLAPIAAAAASGLVALMIGAMITQVFVLHNPADVVTPILIGALMVVVAVARRHRLAAFVRGLRR